MRIFLTFIFVATSSTGFASFDLMYLPDAAFNRVHRIDPVSRLYLGSFSAGSARYVAAHNNSPYVVAGNSSVAVAYQAANGEYVNGASAFAEAATMTSSGNMLAISGASSFRESNVPNFQF